MVNGKVLVENRRLITADEDEILGRAREWQEKIREN
jgi:hypothetical protein